MSELELQRLLHSIAANDKTNAELAEESGKAPSTVYNIKVKLPRPDRRHPPQVDGAVRGLVDDPEAARLDDIQELRDLVWDQLRALLASNVVINGRTGEVMAGPVDVRQFKVLAEIILKAKRNFAEETGQLPQRVEGLDQRFTQPMLGLGNAASTTPRLHSGEVNGRPLHRNVRRRIRHAVRPYGSVPM